jgi:hypothetical protein
MHPKSANTNEVPSGSSSNSTIENMLTELVSRIKSEISNVLIPHTDTWRPIGLEVAVNQPESSSEHTDDTAPTETLTTHTEHLLAPHCTTCTCSLPDKTQPDFYVNVNVPVLQVPVPHVPFPHVNASDRWYTVSKGRQVGVFKDWFVFSNFIYLTLIKLCFRHTVLPLVNGVGGGLFSAPL